MTISNNVDRDAGTVKRGSIFSLAVGVALSAGCTTLTPGLSSTQKPRDPAELLAASPTRSDVQRASYDVPDPGEKKNPENKDLTWTDFSPDNLGKTAKKLTGYGPDREIAYQAFREAEEAYRRGLTLQGNERTAAFISAQEKFNIAADRWPDSALEQDAWFYAGECAFFTDQYPKANEYFEKLIKGYPNNRHMDIVDQRRFVIARWWVEQTDKSPESFWAFNFWDKTKPWRDTRGNAMRVYDKIRIDDPTGRLADDATLAAGNAEFSQKDYLRADDFYEDLRNNFPTSEHQFNAHFLGLKSKLLNYRGSAYTGDDLDEAEKLVKQIRRQFPQDYDKERKFIDSTAAEIRYKQAEREWDRGAYYDFRGEYRAAVSHYDVVVRKFSDTHFAERARNRIPEIQKLPPVPPQMLPWLVNALPESDDIKPLVQAAAKDKSKIR